MQASESRGAETFGAKEIQLLGALQKTAAHTPGIYSADALEEHRPRVDQQRMSVS